MAKPIAVHQLRPKPRSRNSTIPTTTIVEYWRFRYALAPACTAAAISCIRALPAGRRRIDIVETTPYSTAKIPAAIASHSQLLASIRSSSHGSMTCNFRGGGGRGPAPQKGRRTIPHVTVDWPRGARPRDCAHACGTTRPQDGTRACRTAPAPAGLHPALAGLHLERCRELPADRDALQCDVSRQ